MDPNENLKEQLALANHMLDLDPDEVDPDDAQRLVELVESLDKWIHSGGFFPSRWTKIGGRK